MDYRKELGKNIRSLRKSKKLSIKDLAEKSKLTEKYLNTVELGKNNISFDNLIMISEALEIKPYFLFRFSDNKFEKLINQLVTQVSNDEGKYIELYLKIIKNIQETKIKE